MIEKNRNIRELDISRCLLNQEFLDMMVQSLRLNQYLTCLRVDRNSLVRDTPVLLSRVIDRNLCVYEVIEQVLERVFARKNRRPIGSSTSQRGRLISPLEVFFYQCSFSLSSILFACVFLKCFVRATDSCILSFSNTMS